MVELFSQLSEVFCYGICNYHNYENADEMSPGLNNGDYNYHVQFEIEIVHVIGVICLSLDVEYSYCNTKHFLFGKDTDRNTSLHRYEKRSGS